MRKFSGFVAVAALAGALAMVAQAGTIIHQESFEAAPGAGYTMSNQFDDAGFDFFDRYAVPDNANPARDDFQNGWDGAWGILGQDHDGDGFAPTQSVSIPGVNVGGFTGLSVTMSLGALASEAAGFDNYEAADGDGIEIFATVDAGVRTLVGKFSPPAVGGGRGTANAGDLYVDSDFDGVGDGTRLTPDLADFTFGIADVGNALTIEIELTSTSSFEPLALDNVRVSGVPEPGMIALLIVGGLFATRRR